MSKMEEKKTKKRPINNQNLNHFNEIFNKPFALNSPYQKDEKKSYIRETNQSQQTDIDFDIEDDRVTERIIRNNQNNQLEKDVEIDTDMIVNEKGQFQRIENISQRKVSKSLDSANTENDQSDLSLGFEDKNDKNRKPSLPKKKKSYNIRPETLQRHMKQISKKIQKSGYPQNVMKRVYPVSNFIDCSVGENEKMQIEQIPKTKKPKTRAAQNLKNWFSNRESRRQREIRKILFKQKPVGKFEKVDFTEKEVFTIEDNLIWIARVIAKRYIVKAFGKDCLRQEEKLEEQVKEVEQNVLGLHCMTRYRSVIEILLKVNNMLLNYEEHDQYLVDPQRYFQPTDYGTKENFIQNKITIIDFHGEVIEEFSKLLFMLVLSYTQASQQNKQFVVNFYQKNGHCVSSFPIEKDSIIIIESTIDSKTHKVHQMLKEQGIFSPYKGPMYKKEELKKPPKSQKDVEI